MLKRLYINNFALIEEMDVTFPGSLTVITGETGAGKSIFLEALGLALGKRADASVIRNKAKKCVVEAEFDTSSLNLKALFDEMDLDYDDLVTLRREVGADGRSRSFLNDSVVSVQSLKLLSERLIDIHSQHQTLLLNQSNFQIELLDAFADNGEIFKEYRRHYNSLQKISSQIEELKEKEKILQKESDFNRFLFNELDEASLVDGELAKLEDESLSLENAGTIKSSLGATAGFITESDTNVLTMLGHARQALQPIIKYGKSFQELSDRLTAINIELKELSADLVNEGERIVSDNERLEEVNGRMDQLNRLLKKHQVKTEAELIKIREELTAKLEQTDSLNSEIISLEKSAVKLRLSCNTLAEQLTGKRKTAAPVVEKQVKQMLASLSMPNAVFNISIEPALPGSYGSDNIRFLFSANKGMPVAELQKTASGGELSRLMLTLKALLAGKKKLPAIIFDEIDTGVSGDVADKIGTILKKMGSTMQVVAITHLPQMASKGEHHLFVYKKDDADQTVSYIRELNAEERVTEIAKMLSTGKPTESAFNNARELLSA